MHIDVAQVCHVAQRIDQLALRKRPAAPVRETGRLVQILAGDALDEIHVRNRVAEAAHHGGHLRVEHGARNTPRLQVDDLDVLTGSMEDLDHTLVEHELIKRCKINIIRLWIDDRLDAGRGELNEAQLGPEGRFPHELGVDRHEVVAGECGAKLGEIAGGCYDTHDLAVYRRLALHVAAKLWLAATGSPG